MREQSAGMMPSTDDAAAYSMNQEEADELFEQLSLHLAEHGEERSSDHLPTAHPFLREGRAYASKGHGEFHAVASATRSRYTRGFRVAPRFDPALWRLPTLTEPFRATQNRDPRARPRAA